MLWVPLVSFGGTLDCMGHDFALNSNQPQDSILRPRELSSRIGLSLATLWRLRRRGDLPEPIRLSPGCVGWRTSVIDDWLTTRAQQACSPLSAAKVRE